MQRTFCLLLAFAALATSIVACTGYPADQAKDRCDIEQQNQGVCFSDGTYDECLSCFEECGDACAVAESCPVQYVCPKN